MTPARLYLKKLFYLIDKSSGISYENGHAIEVRQVYRDISH